ncbi:hypothetical protein DFH09DRAFT_1102274 [Mycena vulgaris]|nr:hypothetical protein DFH09DRAFT_1102274 [Mycena vulgaris]
MPTILWLFLSVISNTAHDIPIWEPVMRVWAVTSHLVVHVRLEAGPRLQPKMPVVTATDEDPSTSRPTLNGKQGSNKSEDILRPSYFWSKDAGNAQTKPPKSRKLERTCTVKWLVTAQTLMTGFPNWDVMRLPEGVQDVRCVTGHARSLNGAPQGRQALADKRRPDAQLDARRVPESAHDTENHLLRIRT